MAPAFTLSPSLTMIAEMRPVICGLRSASRAGSVVPVAITVRATFSSFTAAASTLTASPCCVAVSAAGSWVSFSAFSPQPVSPSKMAIKTRAFMACCSSTQSNFG